MNRLKKFLIMFRKDGKMSSMNLEHTDMKNAELYFLNLYPNAKILNIKLIAIYIITFLTQVMAYSSDLTPQRLQVLYKVAKEARIDSNDLIRIAYVESKFKQNAVRTNSNGTVDYGMFQINSVHWSTTCRYMNVMTFEGNVRCAAKLVQEAQIHSKRDVLWLGRYHSKTPSKKIKYSKQLILVPKYVLAAEIRK